ncbi:MAG: YicC family protein [Deltaproteobacteria bacterium]|nr:YicC family protein [Deltaproteobacteria bacterium]
MILSMTGFGAGRGRVGEEEIAAEIRSVNHKYCEVKPRLPPELLPLETEVVRQVKEGVRRGALDVTLKRMGGGRSAHVPRLDLALARELVAELKRAGDSLGLVQNLGVAELAQVEGIISFEPRGIDLDAARAAAHQAIGEALVALRTMREREGRALAEDLSKRLEAVRVLAARVRALSPATIDTYRARLEERIAELSRNVPVEPQRLAQEVALFADRVDVAEEITRLDAHFGAFDRLVAGEEPAGRRMDFLVQEMHREVNTIGSKSQSAEIAEAVVGMKAEIERVREQVQNVE